MNVQKRASVSTSGLIATKLCMQSGGCAEKPSSKKIKK